MGIKCVSNGVNLSNLDYFIKKYKKEYLKAWNLVNRGGVKKYVFIPSGVERWIVEGKKRNYIILPNIFCQCEDFYISVVIKRRKQICYHLLAQMIAEKTKKYKEIEMKDECYLKFIIT
jgi:predicted nucleic acid-binding Zn finger protein